MTLESLPPEMLLHEAARVRRLARAIVRDPEAADDLAQDALLAALQRPPRGSANQSVLRAWFARVVRSLAARKGRDARVRERHERAAARAAERQCDVMVGERLEAQRGLLAALAALPELYRTAVSMRYLDGLSPTAIAAALHVDAVVVRQRVHRGLVMLRARLERRFGSPAPVAVLLSGPAAGSWLWVTWIMAMKKTMACVAVAVVGLVCFATQWRDAPDAVPAVDVPSAAPAVASTATPVADEAERSTIAAPRGDAAAPPELTTGTLVVRVRVQDGGPLPGAPVAVVYQRGARDDDPNARDGVTDGRGEVRFDELAPGTWNVVAEGRGKPSKASPNRTVVAAGQVSECDVVVPSGFAVAGFVVDPAGNPVPGARIVSGAASMAQSDASGAFHIEHVQSPLSLRARAKGRVPSAASTIAGADGTTSRVELRIGDLGRRIAGRVRLADGAAAVDAKIAIVPAAARERSWWDPQNGIEWTRTDASGAFACDELGADHHVVVVRTRDLSAPPCWAFADTTQGDAFVELQVPLAATIRGFVVRGAAGVADAQLVCWPERASKDVARVLGDFALRHVRCGPDGAFELRGLVAGTSTVRVLEDGAVASVEEIAVEAGAGREHTFVLPPKRELKIAVRVDAPGTDKRLVAMVKPAGAPADDLGGLVSLNAGAGTWSGRRDGPVDVYVAWMDDKRDMVQLARRRDVQLSEPEVAFELGEQHLPRGWLRGRTVDPSLGPLPSVALSAHRVDGDGLVVRRSAASGGDGSFGIGPLPPGVYELREGIGDAMRALRQVALVGSIDELVGDVVVAPAPR